MSDFNSDKPRKRRPSGESKDELKKVFKEIFPFLDTAIKNAKKGFENFENKDIPISERESSTTVFKLIEKILDRK